MPVSHKILCMFVYDFIWYFLLNFDYSRSDDVEQNGFKSPVVTLIFSTLKAEQQINYTISQACGK